MSLLERLDKAAVYFSPSDTSKGRSSPFCYEWTDTDTRELLEEAAKEIRHKNGQHNAK